MSLAKEFKEFAVKGNVVDLAVGVIIGGAFGKIVTSMVGDIVMPLVGLFVGGVNFTTLAFTLKEGKDGGAPAVMLRYGQFLQNVFDFLIVAAAVFAMVKALNTMKRKQDAAPPTAPPAPPSPTEALLTEIRDLLKTAPSR
jgi:large conductance mechanosensitive channel